MNPERAGNDDRYTCPRCGERFGLRDAAWSDWQDPTRNFGCPACGTFFVRERRPRRPLEHLAQAHYLLAITFTAAYLYAHPYAGLHWLVLPAWSGAAVWLAFRLDRALPDRTLLVPVSPPAKPTLRLVASNPTPRAGDEAGVEGTDDDDKHEDEDAAPRPH